MLKQENFYYDLKILIVYAVNDIIKKVKQAITSIDVIGLLS